MLTHLQKTYLDGVAFYRGENPFIVYTARHDRVDNFWFTITHKLGHVLDHLEIDGGPVLDNLDNEGLSGREREADTRSGGYLFRAEIVAEGKTLAPARTLLAAAPPEDSSTALY